MVAIAEPGSDVNMVGFTLFEREETQKYLCNCFWQWK
jgi:hypothetical protein